MGQAWVWVRVRMPSLARARLASVIPLYSDRVAWLGLVLGSPNPTLTLTLTRPSPHTLALTMMRDAEEREGGSEASSAGSEAVLETPLRLCARARRTLGTSALEPCRPKVEEESADSLRGPTEPESRPGSG